MQSNRTVIKGDPIQKEAIASAAGIQPGMLVEFAATEGQIRAHSTAGGFARPAFAREPDLIGGDQSYTYAENDTVLYVVGRNGDEMQAILAEGQNLTQGTELASAGDGTLRAAAGGEHVVATLMHDADATSADLRVIVEVSPGYMPEAST